MRIKYKCPYCGYIETEKSSWKKVVFKEIPRIIMLASVFLFAVLGLLSSYNFVQVGLYEDPNKLIDLASAWATLNTLRSGLLTSNETATLNSFVEPAIKECEDDYCKARKIYDLIQDEFNYEEGTDLIIEKIMRERIGDCDELSFLYISILKIQGIKSVMECSMKKEHCWVVVTINQTKYIADVTGHRWEEK